MLSGMLKASGILILRLVYGKEYSEKASRKIGLMMLLSIANILWLMSVLFLAAGSASNGTALCVIMMIVYPVAIASWTVIERKKQS